MVSTEQAMQRITRLTLALAMVVALASPALINAQAMSSAEPFKVGTFEIGGAPTVGVVLRDALVIDLAAANASSRGSRRPSSWTLY